MDTMILLSILFACYLAGYCVHDMLIEYFTRREIAKRHADALAAYHAIPRHAEQRFSTRKIGGAIEQHNTALTVKV